MSIVKNHIRRLSPSLNADSPIVRRARIKFTLRRMYPKLDAELSLRREADPIVADFIAKLDELVKPKKGLDIKEGTSFHHYVDRETGSVLCGRHLYGLTTATQKHVDCVGCTIAIQRRFAQGE